MTTITLDTLAPTGQLEELVDRLLAAMFRSEPEQSEVTHGLARSVHGARRLRQCGDLDSALAALVAVDSRQATDTELRWLYAEWLDIARRRFAGDNAALYSPDTGRAAVLVPCEGNGDGTLEVAAVLGMSWLVGKLVSRRSLRSLKPLAKGGASWS